jgi:hypothetical protein
MHVVVMHSSAIIGHFQSRSKNKQKGSGVGAGGRGLKVTRISDVVLVSEGVETKGTEHGFD